MFHFHVWKVLWGKTWGKRALPDFSYDDIVIDLAPGKETWVCTDLGAFQKPVQHFEGLTGVVIMEDRFPEFFLSYDGYKATDDAKLNRHGPLAAHRTHEDLKALVATLHGRGIKVVYGFWNHMGWKFQSWRLPRWFQLHPEITRVPGTSDIHPLAFLNKEQMSYAAYIGHQYEKLAYDFDFDGLFLGDGFSGYRTIANPDRFRDKKDTAGEWHKLYETISRAVHKTGGMLFAYDCLGFSYEEAILHGADYRLLSDAGLDYLVFQSYPQAWGEYWLWRYRDRFNLRTHSENLKTVKAALEGTTTKLLYTVELGDRVEGWAAQKEKTYLQIESHDPFADGRFFVWANDLLSRKK